MFSFAAPLALFGLISLPMIYWLLRVTPRDSLSSEARDEPNAMEGEQSIQRK